MSSIWPAVPAVVLGLLVDVIVVDGLVDTGLSTVVIRVAAVGVEEASGSRRRGPACTVEWDSRRRITPMKASSSRCEMA